MRIDWEGEVLIEGKLYWVYLEYNYEYLLSGGSSAETGPVAKELMAYDSDGVYVPHVSNRLFERLGSEDVRDLVEAC